MAVLRPSSLLLPSGSISYLYIVVFCHELVSAHNKRHYENKKRDKNVDLSPMVPLLLVPSSNTFSGKNKDVVGCYL